MTKTALPCRRIRTPREVAYLSCVHRQCSGERFEVQLRAITALNARMPLLGLAPLLAELAGLYRPEEMVSFCIDCGCLFLVGKGHPAH